VLQQKEMAKWGDVICAAPIKPDRAAMSRSLIDRRLLVETTPDVSGELARLHPRQIIHQRRDPLVHLPFRTTPVHAPVGHAPPRRTLLL